MEYNTDLPPMIIPEYGRNIQKMIDYAITIEDREERNNAVNAIIIVMGQLNPHLRDVTDFKHKLWDHIFIISEFKLDVDSPYPKPTAETFKTKPDRVNYPGNDIRYKHYGKITEELIKKVSQFPEGEEKDLLTEIIANLLKRSYYTWNRDTVDDQVILDQLRELSKGKLKLTDLSLLKEAQAFVPRTQVVRDKNKKQNNGFRQNNRFKRS